jgi:hypothetical protein
MREFFLNLLQNLDKLCGLKQYEKIMQTPKPKEELNMLLDILCRVSDQFTFIPEKNKKVIINEAVISDQEFQGLNARIIYKWLNAKKDQYFTEIAHQPSEQSAEPLTGEARQEKIAEFLNAVLQIGQPVTEKCNPYQEVREQWKAPEGIEEYKPLTDEEVRLKKAHIEYLKSQHGKKPEDFEDELEWQIRNGYAEI